MPQISPLSWLVLPLIFFSFFFFFLACIWWMWVSCFLFSSNVSFGNSMSFMDNFWAW